jgi:polysaccharide export outer membrane protein
MKHLIFTGLLLSVTVANSLQAQALMEHNPPYRLEDSDVVTVTFRYTPEFNQDVTVGPDGRAEVAGLGVVIAEHQTLAQFKASLVELSSKRLVNPELSAVLKTYVKPHVLVGGEVNTPGRVELHGDTSALDAIALAGGFRDSAAKNNVLLLRADPGNGGQTRVVNLTQFLKNHKLEEVPQLRSGDVLYVSKSKFAKLNEIAHLGAFGAIYNPIH